MAVRAVTKLSAVDIFIARTEARAILWPLCFFRDVVL
jgi:hypothetical protein